MPKLNFLDFFGKSVSKERAKLVFTTMGFSEIEIQYLLDRFCSGYENKTIEQCSDLIPVDQQKTLYPELERKLRGWIQHNTGFFCLEELEGFTEYNIYVRRKDYK